MSKSEELKNGLASVGIGWVEPTDIRNKAGLFMLNHGVRMGVAVDPADVQDMLVEFTHLYTTDLEGQVAAWRKLAEDAINSKPNPPLIVDSPKPVCMCGHRARSHGSNWHGESPEKSATGFPVCHYPGCACMQYCAKGLQ